MRAGVFVIGKAARRSEGFMSLLNDEQIIRRAQKGDSEAVAALYQTYVQRIHRYIVYRIPFYADAEDLTSEVFLKMVEGLPQYRTTGTPFEAWLYRIAAARIADYYRARRRTAVELTETYSDSAPQPEEQLQVRQELETVRRALQQLSSEKQTILILRFVERKSHQEVADIIGRSVIAVRSTQHRALAELSTLLGSEEKVRHYLRGNYE
jgi:RNA polymerase sigma-70 factor, ECF subfamily